MIVSIKLKKIGVLCAFLAASAGCSSLSGLTGGKTKTAEAPAQTEAPISAAQSSLTDSAPAMWRIDDEDSTIYLFGTFHLLPPGLEWRTAAFDAAMRETQKTITETDTTSPQAVEEIQTAVQRLGFNPPDVTLSSILGDDRAKRFAQLAEDLGVPMEALEPMRPWLAQLSLTQVVFQRAGLDPRQGVEAAVLAQAAAERDVVEYLETATFQIETLASLDGEDLYANFDATVEQFEEFDALTQRLLDAWRTGDIEGIERDILAALREQSPSAFDKIFAARNRIWAEIIDQELDGADNTFIAVGAGHLAGEDSVLDYLRQRGHAATRVQ